MWTETNQTLQEIHKFVSEKPQDASREEKDLNVNEEVVPAVPPVVNGIVTEDSEYVGKGAMSYR